MNRGGEFSEGSANVPGDPGGIDSEGCPSSTRRVSSSSSGRGELSEGTEGQETLASRERYLRVSDTLEAGSGETSGRSAGRGEGVTGVMDVTPDGEKLRQLMEGDKDDPPMRYKLERFSLSEAAGKLVRLIRESGLVGRTEWTPKDYVLVSFVSSVWHIA